MREEFVGKRVAVAGLGVSGMAVARAVRDIGGFATVLDQQTGDVPRVMEATERLQSEGIDVVTGWHGRLDPADYDLLVVSPGFPPAHPSLRDMAGKVLGEVEFAWRVAEAPMVAITGTNGKSTTSVMTWLALQGAGLNAALCGNISGSGYPEQVLTEAAMSTPSDGVLVAEISSAQLETVTDFCPKAATILNVSDDHLDRYESFEHYRQAKLRMLDRMTADSVFVVNVEADGISVSEARRINGDVRIVEVSPTGRFQGTGQTRRQGGTLWFSGESVEVSDLPWVGEHNTANAMVAWELACAIVPRPDAGMLRGLLEFQPLANRMEPVGSRGGISVVNNSMCTNPLAVVKSSQSLGAKQHLLMGGNTKNMDFSPLRDYLQNSGQKVYLFGSGAAALDQALGGGFESFPSLEAAFMAAVQAAKPGEVVMLAPGCASLEPYANFRERGEAFKNMAKDWLNNEEDCES